MNLSPISKVDLLPNKSRINPETAEDWFEAKIHKS